MQPHNADEYRSQLASLLPKGLAWAGDVTSWLSRLLSGCSQELARVDQRMHDLVAELDPQQSVELMAEWEAATGLPDECSGSSDTLAERRAQLLMKLAATGGQSPAYFEEIAYIYTLMVCTVIEFHPFRAGISAAGDALTNENWLHTWELNAPDMVLREFQAGQSLAGEPLRSWGNETLECIIGRLKPAHTNVIHTYEEA